MNSALGVRETNMGTAYSHSLAAHLSVVKMWNCYNFESLSYDMLVTSMTHMSSCIYIYIYIYI